LGEGELTNLTSLTIEAAGVTNLALPEGWTASTNLHSPKAEEI